MSEAHSQPEQARWLRFARDDLHAGEALFADSSIVPREACFFAQQAAEKAMKAILVAEETDVPRTHDLAELRALQREPVAVEIAAGTLQDLGSWLVVSRYPGEWPEATREDADEALAIARAITEEVAARLDREGRS